MANEKFLTIGKLARATGVKVTTIRYYESIGLIAPPGRSEGKQRLYGSVAVERMSFVRHARELGFSLDAIRDLISLASDSGRSCDAVDAIARRHAIDVRRRIAQLTALDGELQRMLRACSQGKVADCRILAVLADHTLCEEPAHELRN
jgi:DNA-binding transcriptional MerR regulator